MREELPEFQRTSIYRVSLIKYVSEEWYSVRTRILEKNDAHFVFSTFLRYSYCFRDEVTLCLRVETFTLSLINIYLDFVSHLFAVALYSL
jgi:hypothetical protein